MLKTKPKTLTAEAFVMIADRFKTLSDPQRLKMLHLLRDGERNVGDIALLTEASQPNVSKHLKIMQSAGFVRRRQCGNTVFYSIADETIFTLCDVVCDSINNQLQTRVEALA